jgi:Gas vesicle synthesis protein GvpO
MAESRRRTRRKSSSSSSGGSSSKSGSSGSSKSGSSGSSKSGSSGSSSKSGGSGKNRPAREIALTAVEQIHDLIGRPVESVTGIEKNGSEWTVTLEVLELERVPNTTDVLGKYEVTIDNQGDVTSAQRTRRYHRAEQGEV